MALHKIKPLAHKKSTRRPSVRGGHSAPVLPFPAVTGPLQTSLFARIAAVLISAVVVGLVAWQRDLIWRNLGWGIIVGAATGLIVLYALFTRPKPTLSRWNRWLALLGFAAAAWGALSLVSTGVDSTLGGYFGRAIVGAANALGVLRLLAILLAALYLWMPRTMWYATKRLALATWSVLVRVGRAISWAAAKSRPTLAAAATNIAKAVDGAVEKGRQKLARPAARSRAPVQLDTAKADLALAASTDGVVALPPAPVAGASIVGSLPSSAAGRAPDSAPSLPAGAPSLSDLPSSPDADADPLQRPKHKKKASEDGDNDAVPLGKAGHDGWRIPSLEILDAATASAPVTADNDARARRIEEALQSYGIDATVVEINPGPAVTQFGVEPGWVRKFKEIKLKDEDGKAAIDDDGKPLVSKEEVSRTRVKVDAIANLDRDLAMALAVPSIRIEAPIPGKALVGIEVPNSRFDMVSMRAILESVTFSKARAKSKLAIALGKGSSGDPEVADFAKMPHVLVAGATGSGKSVCINAFLVSILMNATPNEVRLILVDPKRVEMTPFNSVPHLLMPVIVEVDKVVSALRWALKEMDERYKKFAAIGVRNLEAYNKDKRVVTPLPFLVIAIDELADLMMVAPMDVEHSITRLAQLGRATGIHLLVATQRPSVNVVTGLIKANFPTRMSFAVSSQVDSRTILDSVGAEKLLGKGDMLYLPQDAPKPKRIQGVYVSDREVERVVRAWNSQSGTLPPQRITLEEPAPVPVAEGLRPSRAADENANAVAQAGDPAHPNPPSNLRPPSMGEEDDDLDPLLEQARQMAGQNVRLSPSLLQRRLRIGYTKARRLLELLEEEGLVDSAEEEARS